MNQALCIHEWSYIHKSKLSATAWNELANLADSSDKNFQFLRFKNSSTLQVKGFVGVISTACGSQIEILPKTERNTGWQRQKKP